MIVVISVKIVSSDFFEFKFFFKKKKVTSLESSSLSGKQSRSWSLSIARFHDCTCHYKYM